MSFAGRILYRAWHAPIGKARALIDAGVLDSYRTSRGRRAMEKAAFQLPLLPTFSTPPIELHLLTGHRFWYQTAFCLWTFARHTRQLVAPVLYDDGTLDESLLCPLRRLFPTLRCISKAEAIAKLDQHLPADRFPTLRERWTNYPNLRKLIDPHLASSGWKLVIDSDLLFFRTPTLLLDWLSAPSQPLHAIDSETSYGYRRETLDRLAGHPLADLVNVGLCGLNSAELDWEKLEHGCRELIHAEGTHYYLEQALVAMLVAGRACTVAPAGEYVTMPQLPEARSCRAVMHHYVAHSKRWYFQRNWRHALAQASDSL